MPASRYAWPMLKTASAAAVVMLLASCKPSEATATREAPVATVPAPKVAAPVETNLDRVAKLATFAEAMAFTKPKMDDSVNKLDEGTALLALWSAKGLVWADVAVTKNETTFAAVLKDPDEARGKRVCVSGSIVEIEVEKVRTGKIFDGLLHDYAGNLYKFSAVRGTGDLVAQSQTRMCGVITGKYDYSNSAGGTGHAIKIVGIFDLPENKR